MERQTPNFSKAIIANCMLGKDKSPEAYKARMEKFERSCEKSLIETLSRLDIKGMVKTDPYSLPYKKEIKIVLPGESYMNAPFEFFRAARQILKQLLHDNEYQLRFYLYINIIEGQMGFGKVEYCFRYSPK